MRYRLIRPDWAKVEDEENSFDGDNLDANFLAQKNQEGYGVYYFPNYNAKPFPGNYLSGKHVDVFEWVYVDMDLKDGVYADQDAFKVILAEFEVLPTKVVSSGNGVHAYWRVTDLTRERFCELQVRLIKHFKTDRSIWTVLRCMRLEGYYNTKDRDNFKFVEADNWEGGPYKYEELVKHLPKLDSGEEQKIMNHLRKIDGQAPEFDFEELDVDDLPERFLELLETSKKANRLFFDESGDKSENAWHLVNILYEKDFSKAEAMAIIANCPKSLSKGDQRFNYTAATVDKAYKGKAKYVVPSAADMALLGEDNRRKGRLVHGPEYFDCLHAGWRTQQMLGLVAGSGIGKTTVTLDIFRSILENSEDSSDVCIFFSLEMSTSEIMEKWQALTRDKPEMSKRMFIVSNEDREGNPLNLNLQKIYWFCRDISKSTGSKILAIAIDHIGVVNNTIDITKKPDFGMLGEMEGAYGDLRNISLRKMPQLIKEMAKQLDTFIIIQSQTTKAKSAEGDVPLGLDSAFGVSSFENFVDFAVTLCQPLRRVTDETDLKVLGWQYVKARHRHKLDKVQTHSLHVLNVDLDTGRLSPLNPQEMEEFKALNTKAAVLRKKTEKKDELEYKNSVGGIAKLKSLLAVK